MARRLQSPLARAWRAKGMNAPQLAEKLGLSPTHVYDLAAGRRRPSAKVLAQLCQFFGMPPQELFPDLFDTDAKSA